MDKASLLKSIMDVKIQLEQGVDKALMSRAERSLIDKFLILKTYGGKLSVMMNDQVIIKASKYYGCFVLVSNETMETFSALREYQLRERTEEGFRIDKQYNDAHVTRPKTASSLEGRFFASSLPTDMKSFSSRH